MASGRVLAKITPMLQKITVLHVGNWASPSQCGKTVLLIGGNERVVEHR